LPQRRPQAQRRKSAAVLCTPAFDPLDEALHATLRNIGRKKQGNLFFLPDFLSAVTHAQKGDMNGFWIQENPKSQIGMLLFCLLEIL
jgi:hypothetical protein